MTCVCAIWLHIHVCVCELKVLVGRVYSNSDYDCGCGCGCPLHQVGVVEQSARLLSGSIAENIRYGSTKVPVT
jgi:hypothetical protein